MASPRNVVIVDDNPLITDMLAEIVEDHGHISHVFTDPLVALRQVFSFVPDLILVDLNMPRMDGLTFCEQIVSTLLGDAPPIIVVSGTESSAAITRAFDIGVADFITKPIHAGLLGAKMRQALGELETSSRLPPPGRPPRYIGPFVVESELGRGGMGVVYRARDKRGRVVALKTCWPRPNQLDDLLRFRREVGLLQSLNHPRLVRILEAGREGDMFFYAMEMVHGESLEERLNRLGARPLSEVLSTLDALAEALEALHGQKLVHRDVKPANILCCHKRGPILSDLGLARHDSDNQVTTGDRIVGTPHYLSPEMVFGEAVDHRADLFSAGIVAIEMILGRTPVEASSPYAAMSDIAVGAFPRGATLLAEGRCGPRVADLLDRLTATQRDQRPPTATAVRQELETLLADPAESFAT